MENSSIVSYLFVWKKDTVLEREAGCLGIALGPCCCGQTWQTWETLLSVFLGLQVSNGLFEE